MREATLYLVVQNQVGVLAKIAGLFGRRGYQIKSLHAEEVENSNLSHMVLITEGDSYTLDQTLHQMEKLEDVLEIKLVPKTEEVPTSLVRS